MKNDLLLTNLSSSQKPFLITFLVFIMYIVQSQTFNIVLNTEGRSGFSDSKEDGSGNIILCGGERNLPYFTAVHALVLKVSHDGDTIFRAFNFGGDTMSYLNQVIVVDDVNYIFFGDIGKEDSISGFKEMKNIWVIKLDENLNTVWDKRYEVPGNYWNPSCKVWRSNDHIYAAGEVDWWDGYHRVNFFMAKFNLEGDTLKTSYPYMDDPMQYPIGGVVGCAMGRPNGDEGMMVIGKDFMVSEEEGIVEVDSNLNYVFNPLTFPGNFSALNCPSIKRLSDVSYVWSSSVHLTYQGNMDMLVARVNQNHQFTDYYIYGRQDTADFPAPWKCIDFEDPNYIYVASRNNYLPSDPIDLKASVALFDSSLNMKGWKWFGGDMNYYITNITATSDGGCVIGGKVCDWQISPDGDVDLWVKKIMSEDIITYAEETPDPNDSDVLVYPNPAHTSLYVKTFRKNLVLKIFNMNGVPVLAESMKVIPEQMVNISSLKKGSYTYQVWDKSKNMVIDAGTLIKN